MRHTRLALTVGLLLLVAVPGWAATWIVADTGNPATNGANLQNVLSSSVNLGDTVLLTGGATYFSSGGFTFTNKGTGTGTDADYITVQPISLSGCPASGVRVDPPTHAAAMPKLVASGQPAVAVNVRAHHWKFICLEVTNDQVNYSSGLILTATNGTAAGGNTTYDELYNTHDIIFDRLFVHNPEVTASNLHPQALEIFAGRGIGLTGVNLSVLNSWIGSFAGYFPGTAVLTDSYGIFGGLGGPMTIQNNRIEAFFNNIFWTASIANPDHTGTLSAPTLTSATLSSANGLNVGDFIALEVPTGTNGCVTNVNNPKCWQTAMIDTINSTNVTYHGVGKGFLTVTPVNGGIAQWNGSQPVNLTTKQNYLWKNPWWQVQWLGGAKDYIEVKTCVNCTYTGNTFAGACSGSIAFEVAQSGSNGGHPWNTITNNIVRSNLFLGDANAVYTALGGAQPSGQFTVSNVPGSNITVTNNLWQHVPRDCGGNPNVSGFLQTSAGRDVTFTHNTVRNLGGPTPVYNSGLGDIEDGINYGQTNLAVKDNIFDFSNYGFNYNNPHGYQGAWPTNGVIETKNVVINRLSVIDPSPTQAGEMPNSYIVANDAAVGFVNVTGADAGGDYHGYALASNSPFKGRASDGTDPGVDFAALDAALSLGNSDTVSPAVITNLQLR